MKNQVPFLSVLLVVWIVGGSLLYKSICCRLPGTGFTIKDGATTVASAEKNVVFAFNTLQPEVPNPSYNALEQSSQYLKAHPEKVLIITGSAASTEENPNNELGLKRSQSLQPYLEELEIPNTQVLFQGSSEKEDIEISDDLVYNLLDFQIQDIPNFAASVADDAETFSLKANRNLTFNQSGYAINTPISEDMNKFLADLAEFLNNNSDRTLVITGQSSDSEENTSILPNLGLARATAIKNQLVDLGVKANQMEITSQEDNELIFPGNQLYGGALYHIKTVTQEYAVEKEEAIEKIEDELKQKSITLYFETDASSLQLDSEQRAFFGKLIQYLDNKSVAKVNVIGHTDNKGTNQYNQKLSEERASFIKAYLVRNGLNGDQILTIGKGSRKPISGNKTEDGRSQNRRVEISVKQ